MSHITYRKLKKYKYQLLQEYRVTVDLAVAEDIITGFVDLKADGELRISTGYAWDGASGPSIDTKTFMRGSLIHDALYQLMRLGHLDSDRHREQADAILSSICLEDGMNSFRAWYVYKSVRLFGAGSARKGTEYVPESLTAP